MSELELSRRRLLTSTGALAGAGLLASESALAMPDEPLRPMGEAMPGAHDLERSLLGASAFERLALRPAGWHPSKLYTQGIATSLWAGQFYGLNRRERRDEAFANEFRARAGGMSDTLLATARSLEERGPDGYAEVDDYLADHPELLTRIRESMFHEMLVGGAPEHLERRYDKAFRSVAWRLKHQGAAALADDFVDRLDRLGDKHDVDWRKEAWAGRNRPFYRAGDAEHYRLKAKRNATIGLVLLGSSLATFAIGGVISAATYSAWPIVILATPGVILLITGGIFLLVAAVQKGKATRLGAAP